MGSPECYSIKSNCLAPNSVESLASPFPPSSHHRSLSFSDSVATSPRKRRPSASRVALDSGPSNTSLPSPPADPLALRSVASPATTPRTSPTKSKTSRRKTKRNTADSCIRRLCASHQTDIGLLCELWSSASPQTTLTSSQSSVDQSNLKNIPSPASPPDPVVIHTPVCAETERQRLLQLEMQLMRMQLQKAELLLPPSRPTPSPSNTRPLAQDEPRTPSDDSLCQKEEDAPRPKPQLRLPLDDESSTPSLQIAHDELQNLLWSESDYRAKRKGSSGSSKPASPDSPLDDSDLRSASPSGQTSPTHDFYDKSRATNASLCQGYVKMPRGLFCKFWCAKKRFCMLDSARCFFYWKSKEQRDSGRAKCLSGVTGGALLSGDDKTIEMTYAGGACMCLLKFDTAAEAKRWLVALALLDSESFNRRMQTVPSEAGSICDQGVSVSNRSCSLVSTSKSSLNPELLRKTIAQADCNSRREVIQSAFLNEFLKEQQFEQLMRSSKGNSTSSCALESQSPFTVLRGHRVH